MKRVVSVSLGSSTRDKKVEADFLGERFMIERIGTDGSVDKAKQLFHDLDGKVDCFGMGGIDFYVRYEKRYWYLKEAMALKNIPQITPMVDGGGVKDTLEKKVIQELEPVYGIPVKGKKVLICAAVARFNHVEAFREVGAEMLFGDLMFVLEVPIKLRSLKALSVVAHLVAPIARQLPISMLYPTGESQTKPKAKFADVYKWADIIAGDFHYVHRFIPERLDGKGILTNTVTATDVEDLKARGLSWLVATTPQMEGRSFATNVIEALLVAMSGKKPEELTHEDYLDLIERAKIQPTVMKFDQ